MKFYADRTVQEQKARLPQQFQEHYAKTQLDRIEIDGNIIRGYFEYSYLDEKSYFEQPTRSSNGAIENINSYASFLTPRIVIRYNMMHIDDYRKLMTLLQSKNEFTVTCYDIVKDKRVTHKMYFAPTQMPIIYQQYLMAMGVQNYEIELIGTNNDIEEYSVVYDFNLPQGYGYEIPITSSRQTFYKNSSGIIGENAVYEHEGSIHSISSEYTLGLLDNKFVFQGWNTKIDGSGITYIDGDAYFISKTQRLYAMWR